MASLSFLTDVQSDDLCRSEISIKVCVCVHVSCCDISGRFWLSKVGIKGRPTRAKPGAFGRPGFKGCYHLFCQIQQSPVLWLASCLVRTLCFLFHSHSLRWDSISLKRHRGTWWTVSRVVAEDVRKGTDLFKTKAGSLYALNMTHIKFFGQMLFLVGLIRKHNIIKFILKHI